MAECNRFVCSHCAQTIESWSDGNPYYRDASGAKHYAYHPDHEALARCIGNDTPHLCLQCGHRFQVDSRAPLSTCPACAAATITPTAALEGSPCPFCKAGTFQLDRDFWCMS